MEINTKTCDNSEFPELWASIPLLALGPTTRAKLERLNKKIICKTPDGNFRDSRGLLHHSSINPEIKRLFPVIEVPNTLKVLDFWMLETGLGSANIATLIRVLRKIDRSDVIEEIKKDVENDVEAFTEESQVVHLLQFRNRNLVTTHDIYDSYQNLLPRLYKVFVLYDQQDWELADGLKQHFTAHNISFCCQQDLIQGIPLTHEGTTELIQTRCRKMLILFSRNFCQNLELVSFVKNFMRDDFSLGRVIPCEIEYWENSEVLPELSAINRLKFYKNSSIVDNKKKLVDTLNAEENPETLGNRLPMELTQPLNRGITTIQALRRAFHLKNFFRHSISKIAQFCEPKF